MEGRLCNAIQAGSKSKRMASDIRIEVIQKETIRPSSPTPHQLRSYNLSAFDQLIPENYVPLLLFYPRNSTSEESDHHSLVAERSKLLKTSLSEAITHFYPLAGSYQHNVSICCNDHGVQFIEARVNCPISKILDNPDLGMLKQFLATDAKSTQTEAGYLLLVQANLFECGGMAIGVSISHKITDGFTLSTFITSWASIALASTTTDHHVVLPAAEFGAAASLFPPLEVLNSGPTTALEIVESKVRTRRFVFDASKIAALKSKAASATVPNPTRVEVVSALIWKCAMEASRSNFGSVRPSVWCQTVNLRKRLGQPLAENLLGNIVGYFAAKTEESEEDVQSLVAKLRKGIEEIKEHYANRVSGEDLCESLKEYGNLMERGDIDNYRCTSWCRFSFYGANFGWGKPLWMWAPRAPFKHTFLLIDSRDGVGIEASLAFKEEDMAIIETNKDLLAYASMNPTII